MLFIQRILIVIIALSFTFCTNEHKVEVIIQPSFEDCDDFNCIWRIDSIIKGDISILGKQVYLMNRKKEYNDTDSQMQYFVKGTYTDKRINEHYAMCGKVYEFFDDTLIQLK